MARPQKQTVEYFPHYVTSGKTLFILDKKFGNNGYAFWFKLLELLGASDGHWYSIQEPADLMFLEAKTGVSGAETLEILNTLSELSAIDPCLYDRGVIWCDKFVQNLAEVYRKRKMPLPVKPSFRDGNESFAWVSATETHENGKKAINPAEDCKNDGETPIFKAQNDGILDDAASVEGMKKACESTKKIVSGAETPVSVAETQENYHPDGVSVAETRQSKVKKSRVEKRKEKIGAESANARAQNKNNKRKNFVPPTKTDVVKYFEANGYTAESGGKAWDYYEAGEWKDARGQPVKSWKQKMQGVWFKPENKSRKTGINEFAEKIYTSTPDEDIGWLRSAG